MTWPVITNNLKAHLDFHNDRISDADAERQFRTVDEVISRLNTQPGIVLADEVGMGKTFVALGVATIVALSDKGRNPVVVMVPPPVHEKWHRDFKIFSDRVLRVGAEKSIRVEKANNALEFFKLIDDHASIRSKIIFLKHGAFHTRTVDSWVKLALIQFAMHGLHLRERRTALPKFAARILSMRSTYNDPQLFARLLAAPCNEWKTIINGHYMESPDLQLEDDPVPKAVQRVLEAGRIDLRPLKEGLVQLPARETTSVRNRIRRARQALNAVIPGVWEEAIANAKFRSPLLILDEAHHLKNPATKLASLFIAPEAENDRSILSGALNGAFERMMFLTATPFQLGHNELLNVIDRFRGVSWRSLPEDAEKTFGMEELPTLRKALDTAQHRTTELDSRWQSLKHDDIPGFDGRAVDADEILDSWWNGIEVHIEKMPKRVQEVKRIFDKARESMRDAENVVKKWVIRHARDRKLPGSDIQRRERELGARILGDSRSDGGLPVAEDALLPFLLATRANSLTGREKRMGVREIFAEGLVSSYEAFLETRQGREIVYEDSEGLELATRKPNRYVEKMASSLPSANDFAKHPKIGPVVECVLRLWESGEKVVIFCHYRETGKALLSHISQAMYSRIWESTAARYQLSEPQFRKAVENYHKRFDKDGAMRRHLDEDLADRMRGYEGLDSEDRDRISDVIRRFISSPIFIARYFNINSSSSERTLRDALAQKDASGRDLESKIDAFLAFIANRCSQEERDQYLEALDRIQPGIRFGAVKEDAVESVEEAGGTAEMPNVRIANGVVKNETRQRLMLAFNTPFFPEVLVASSVLAEGVDLHLNCRYVIHHDLSWNPSTLEQRTGRVDRIGAKAEAVKLPIFVYLPYIGGTQDEKQFRVVMDRERWFQVLMGEDYRIDEQNADALARRVPFPAAAAQALAFDLSVWHE